MAAPTVHGDPSIKHTEKKSRSEVILALVIIFVLGQLTRYEKQSSNSLYWLGLALKAVLPAVISLYGVRKGSLDSWGGALAFAVGLVHSLSSCTFSHSLIAFFILGSRLSKWKLKTKQTFESLEDSGPTRDWRQVFCNGAVSSIASIAYSIFYDSSYYRIYFALVVLSSISCCCGDTFASEVGSVVDSCPRLVTTFRRVPRGTNGGVSVAGTLASIAGGVLIGLTFFLTQQWTLVNQDISLALILLTSLCGGLFGSLIDSLLGATLQYSGVDVKTGRIFHAPSSSRKDVEIKHVSGRQVLNNNHVNLLSSLITGVSIPCLVLTLLH